MAVPVLCYHSANIDGNTYSTNNNVALARDLETIDRLNFRVVPLARLADFFDGVAPLPARAVVLTCDDGMNFDYHDISHPTHGPQKSFATLLRAFRDRVDAARQPCVTMTSFVIASPRARQQIDVGCLGGTGLMSDAWWAPAHAEGVLTIGSHSLDHNHPLVDPVAQRDQNKGRFDTIETDEECAHEVDEASHLIAQRIGTHPEFFAYPWGQSSAHLREIYFPAHGARLGLRAALNTSGGYVTEDSPRWNLPRFMCGDHWQSPQQLEDILVGALDA